MGQAKSAGLRPFLPTSLQTAGNGHVLARNQDAINRVNGNLGSALGFKTIEGVRPEEPAIIVFVPHKMTRSG